MRPISRWHYQFLGLDNFPARLGEHEIPAFFTFPKEEIDEISAKYKERYRIGIALMLGFVRMTGRTMEKIPQKLPKEVLQALADQFGLPDRKSVV